MAITAPGMRPAPMSAFKISPMRANRSDDIPTDSGLAIGNGGSAQAASAVIIAIVAAISSVRITVNILFSISSSLVTA